MATSSAPAVYTYEVRSYDIYDDREYPKTITAETRGKAKYAYWELMRDYWDMTFGELLPTLRVKTIGRFKPADLFGDLETLQRVSEYRSIPFVHLGMRIEVDGHMGTIVGANNSSNLDVCFDGQWWKENAHPWWKTKYYAADGTLIRDYTEVEAHG